MMVVCDFHIALDANVSEVKSLIHEVLVTSRFAYLKKPVVITLNEVIIADRLALPVRAKAYVLDVRYEKAFQSDVIERVSKLLIEHKVPRPNREPSTVSA